MGSIVNEDLHYIDWRDWHPRVLTSADLPLLADTPKLFARKLQLDRDPALFDELDRIADSRSSDHDSALDALVSRYLRPAAR